MVAELQRGLLSMQSWASAARKVDMKNTRDLQSLLPRFAASPCTPGELFDPEVKWQGFRPKTSGRWKLWQIPEAGSQTVRFGLLFFVPGPPTARSDPRGGKSQVQRVSPKNAFALAMTRPRNSARQRCQYEDERAPAALF